MVSKNIKLQWLGVLLLNFGVFSPLIFNRADFALDKDWILGPIHASEGIGDFFSKLIQFQFTDISPVRDISHFFDFLVLKYIGIDIAIFHNWLLFILGIFLFYKIMLHFFDERKSRFITFIILFHPLFINVVYIETWRKHLLALDFALIAFFIFLQKQELNLKEKGLIAISFLLSLLAVPIHILLPLIFTLYEKTFRGIKIVQSLKRNWMMFISASLLGILNLIYYQTTFSRLGVGQKFVGGDWGDRLLSIGRGIIQIVYPMEYTVFYARGSFENMIGIGVLIILLYISWKLIKRSHFLLGWSCFFAPLLVINLKTTQMFLLDAYLLLSLLAITFIAGSCFSATSKKFKVIGFSFAIFLAGLSLNESLLRTDLYKFYQTSYKREPACPMLHNYMYLALLEKNKDEVINVGRDTVARDCTWVNTFNSERVNFVMNYYFYFEPDIELNKKEAYFYQRVKLSLQAQLILISIYLQQEKFQQAEDLLQKFLAEDAQVEIDLIEKFSDGIIFPDIIRFCSSAAIPSCKQLEALINR